MGDEVAFTHRERTISIIMAFYF